MRVRTGVGAAVRAVVAGLVLSPLLLGCGAQPDGEAEPAVGAAVGGAMGAPQPAQAEEAAPEEEAAPAPRGSEDWRIHRPAR
ncbi:MAG TPA: hypothetical protein VGD39_12370, partial [Nocardioides sp.]